MIQSYRVFLVVGALALVGCIGGDADADAYEAADAPVTTAPEQAQDTRCEEGRTVPCDQFVGRHGSVTSCFRGVITCVDGQWSTCQAIPVTPDPEEEPDASAPPSDEEQ